MLAPQVNLVASVRDEKLINQMTTNFNHFKLSRRQSERKQSTFSFLAGVDGIIQNHGIGFNISQLKELDVENAVMSTTGSKCLQEAFCKHEELLLSKCRYRASLH